MHLQLHIVFRNLPKGLPLLREMNSYKLLTEVFTVPFGEAHLVYAPLRRTAFVANGETVATIKLLAKGALESPNNHQLELIRFLDAIGLMGDGGDQQVFGLGQDIFAPIEVTLLLTSECNLRCKYCYASAGDVPIVRMTLESAKRGIDYVLANALRIGSNWIGVHYHGGGEPTLNHEVLIASREYAAILAQEHQLQVYSTVTTNGVIPPGIRHWIISNLHAASVSLDGPPSINDLNRPNRSGAGSGNKVLETLKEFDEARFKYGIRVTVTAFTVAEIPNIIQFIVQHAQPHAIRIEPVYNIGRGSEISLQVDVASFVEGYIRGKEIAQKAGIPLLYSAARLNTLSSRFCRAYGEGFTLTSEGKVTGCFEVTDAGATFSEKMIFGRFDEPESRFIFDDTLLTTMRMHNVSRQPYCDDCFAKWHCSGDCPNKVNHALIDGQFSGMPSCEITRSILLSELIELIEQSGGVVWRG